MKALAAKQVAISRRLEEGQLKDISCQNVCFATRLSADDCQDAALRRAPTLEGTLEAPKALPEHLT